MSEAFEQYGADDQHKDDDYRPSEALRAAVNTAIAVEQPLVVTGEPGTGKTVLAQSIAKRLSKRLQMEVPFYKFVTRSDHQAKDCLYRFDALRRLYDVQAQKAQAGDAQNYIELMALGSAIERDQPSVVLIDEIDKAPVDFPNDLLGILEEKLEFHVPETNTWIGRSVSPRKHRPFILITSNEERQLPDAFLRRCVYHHIEFPSRDELRNIVQSQLKKKLGETALPEDAFLEALLSRFEEVRALREIGKKPATHELISWARILIRAGIVDPNAVKTKALAELYPGTILKLKADLHRYAAPVKKERAGSP